MRKFVSIVGVVLLCVVGGAFGASLPRHFGTSAYTISYADFISVMLTAISLLMALLGFFIAMLAFIGWTSISGKVAADVSRFLAEGFKDGGPLHKLLMDETNRARYEGVLQVDEEFQEDVAQAEQLGEDGES